MIVVLFVYACNISIHAPARGATGLPANTSHFPSISIHAPARGATLRLYKFHSIMMYFNPRSREGSDISRPERASQLFRFQSTLPRGERPLTEISLKITSKFQSTLPRGERRSVVVTATHDRQFQSTLPRGERLQKHTNN